MKSLPLKLGVLVVIIFALTITALLLYKPLRLRWYESKLDAGDTATRRRAVEKLLTLGGGKPILMAWYGKRLDSDDIEERCQSVRGLFALNGGWGMLKERILGKSMKWMTNRFGIPGDTILSESQEDNSCRDQSKTMISRGEKIYWIWHYPFISVIFSGDKIVNVLPPEWMRPTRQLSD
ncbi:MAG: hypothetical protein ACYS8W_16495 [Planctomycetota bacterium]|jgi:hypothetical protein